MEKGSSTRMKVIYTEMVNKLLFDYSKAAWTKEGLAGLCRETLKFKMVAERSFAPYCSYDKFALEFCHLDLFVENLRWCRVFLFTDTPPFEHFIVLKDQS